MKKQLLALILIGILILCPALAEDAAQVAALKGPTAMGMVQMMRDEAEAYDFALAASADEITPALIQGRLDIAAIPANLAAVLYNRTNGGIKVLAVNTLGVLYIAERGDSIHNVSDLKGRTLYTAGKGSTPEYALNYILRGNGLDPERDVRIEFKSEHAECLSALLSDPDAVAMLPQPFATIAQGKADDLRVALDLTKEWDALQADSETPSTLITGVAVARTEFIESHPETVSAFLRDYESSIRFTLENTAEAARLIGEYDIFDAAVAEKALPQCSITFIQGDEMRGLLSGYLAVLYEQGPSSVGGSLPDEAFYFAG